MENMQRQLAFDPDEHQRKIKIHATLLLLGWGFFIPVSLFVNSHLGHLHVRHHEVGVHFHMAVGALGLILALAGFGYGIENFSTLPPNQRASGVPTYNYAHAIIGSIATAGVCLQVVLMLCMRPPKSREEGHHSADWPWWQTMGHVTHRAGGFVWMLVAWVALEMGTHMTSFSRYPEWANQDEKYSAALIGTVVATILTVVVTVQLIHKKVPSTSQQISHHDGGKEQVEVEKGEAAE